MRFLEEGKIGTKMMKCISYSEKMSLDQNYFSNDSYLKFCVILQFN